MARTATQDRTGFVTSPNDHQTQEQAAHKNGHDTSGQSTAQWTPKDESNYQRAMKNNHQTQGDVAFVQEVGENRATHEKTMQHLADTAANSHMADPKRSKDPNHPDKLDVPMAVRLKELEGTASLSNHDASEYRSLLWEAHDLSMERFKQMALSDKQQVACHNHTLAVISDAVALKKQNNFENGVTNDSAAVTGQQAATGQRAATGQAAANDTKAAAGSPAAQEQSAHTQTLAPDNDFWTRYMKKHQEDREAKEKLENKTTHPAATPEEHRPKNNGMDQFLTRWANRPPPGQSPEAGNAEKHQTQGKVESSQAKVPGAAEYLASLSGSEQAKATQAFESAVDVKDKGATTFQQMGAELKRGEATEETTTQWMLSQGQQETLDEKKAELLQNLHDKPKLDQDEVRVYAHLIHESAQNLAHQTLSTDPDKAVNEYINNVAVHMIQAKWMENPPDRTAEDILNDLKKQKEEQEEKSLLETFKNIFRRNRDEDDD